MVRRSTAREAGAGKTRPRASASGLPAGSGASPGPSSDQQVGQSGRILSVDEIIDTYPGEWILLRTMASEHGWPTHGEVLAHSRRRAIVEQRLDDLLPKLRATGARHTVFQAYPLVKTGAEMMELLDNVEDLDPDLALRFR